MASASTKITIGAFTIGGMILFVCALLFLGGGSFFDKKSEYVLYFQGSVSGLNVGAPVFFRGVPLGNVTRISLVFDSKNSAFTIPVYIQITESSIARLTGEHLPSQAMDRILQHMIKKGLSARMQLSNLVTSSARIELDYHTDAQAKKTTNAANEIPTVPSHMDALQQSLLKMPLRKMVRTLHEILVGVSTAIGDGKELKESISSFHRAFDSMGNTFATLNELLEQKALRADIQQIVANAKQVSATIDTELPKLLARVNGALTYLAKSAEHLSHVTAFAEQMLNKNSPAVQDMHRLLKEASEAARSLHNLANMLNRNPEALLKGKQGGR